MAVIKGYYDDSNGAGAWTVAGFVGFDDQWKCFEAMWPILLDTHDVPYLHMKELANPNGVYKKWHPPQEHYAEMAAFFGDVAKIIGECGIEGFGGLTRLGHLQRFNVENGLSLESYPLAAFGNLISLWHRHPREPVELFFDHVEKVQSKLCRAKAYADADPHYANDFDAIQMIPVNKAFTFRDLLPLQAADFLAWEWRKNHIDRGAWWDQEGKPEDWNEQWRHFEEWMNREHPRTRKSIMALLERINFVGFIWSYEKLNEAHKIRRGVWEERSS